MSYIYVPGTLPEKVKKGIGNKGWEALSWAICNDWVPSYKWLFSEATGCDVGTPYTVQTMLMLSGIMSTSNCLFLLSEKPRRNKFEKVGTGDLIKFNLSLEPHQAPAFYQLMVEGYLLGTDFISYREQKTDEDGKNQLEGELRRFCRLPFNSGKSRLVEIGKNRSLPITEEVVSDFCCYAFLSSSFQPFCQALGIKITG